jgi:hypothetical protein
MFGYGTEGKLARGLISTTDYLQKPILARTEATVAGEAVIVEKLPV